MDGQRVALMYIEADAELVRIFTSVVERQFHLRIDVEMLMGSYASVLIIYSGFRLHAHASGLEILCCPIHIVRPDSDMSVPVQCLAFSNSSGEFASE